ncbi:aminotransferase class V-fold PLP-dependent enzyme [Natronoglycomyces albus]|uniref:glutamate decarboxylase n=1 Tax=Natronoglycomyces albus TaxID=2811108 RepID=A0A895XT63_9ACTN|nr:aminotransferase class V-fold PLP-dependent enzyme [Natronoglycomyces albus]QSB06465.1 aminotransferase class V-fold PLP-dependent enzyme [Natronoglycomyces albus]
MTSLGYHATSPIAADHLDIDLDVAVRNLGSYTTAVLPEELARILDHLGGHNIVNNSEYPFIPEMVARCIERLSLLWHRQDPKAPAAAVSGSTEAAMLAGLCLLHRWKQRNSTQRPNLVVGSGAHICWKRFCAYWDVDLRAISSADNQVLADPDRIAKACNDNTIGVVATVGYSEHGLFDDVASLSEALRFKTQLTPIHVDAASGGFTAPFLASNLDWDFRLERVVSISASGHKFGQTSLGLGWILWRSEEFSPEYLWRGADYIGDGKPDIGLTFSRSAAPVAQQDYLLSRPGALARYRLDLSDCSHFAAAIADVVGTDPAIRIVNSGSTLPVVAFCDREPGTVERWANRMRHEGWIIPTYPLEANPRLGQCVRIVVKPGLPPHARDRLLASVLRSTYHGRH